MKIPKNVKPWLYGGAAYAGLVGVAMIRSSMPVTFNNVLFFAGDPGLTLSVVLRGVDETLARAALAQQSASVAATDQAVAGS